MLGGCAWIGVTCALLARYRHRTPEDPLCPPRTALFAAAVSVAYAVVLLMAGLRLPSATAVLFPVVLLSWPPGVRMRLLLLVTVVLAVLAVADAAVMDAVAA